MRTIQECTKIAQDTMERSIRYAKEEYTRQMKRIDDCFMLMPMLLADGFDARESWSHGYINIYINHDENFGRNMAKLRGIIGRMVLAGKEVADAKAKTITVRLDCCSYPNVTVQYNCKLPKTSKCKIKISRKYEPELVCER